MMSGFFSVAGAVAMLACCRWIWWGSVDVEIGLTGLFVLAFARVFTKW